MATNTQLHSENYATLILPRQDATRIFYVPSKYNNHHSLITIIKSGRCKYPSNEHTI
ncbi:hypothetical protein HanXRQr2_Chr15g0693931 [Helianthus annuus]|uniref:Uncharacterized protein n=1 Tax=Helianthus annuus TaxID=4232 RepID=A0A9K3DZX3_HELAN|nr:hypothetical protein HanXRQr2_Chr15g0693931 [Helianthus annuus]KAJ0831326.1 hypothetical protein HanPSC8_Chr15g0665801 [Helianthus annuus]